MLAVAPSFYISPAVFLFSTLWSLHSNSCLISFFLSLHLILPPALHVSSKRSLDYSFYFYFVLLSPAALSLQQQRVCSPLQDSALQLTCSNLITDSEGRYGSHNWAGRLYIELISSVTSARRSGRTAAFSLSHS